MTFTAVILLVLGLIVVLCIILVLIVIGIYNTLVRLRNRYENAYAQIDVQLKRRNDLIPNLIETVKGYMAHERETLEGVVAARSQALSAGQAAAAKPGDPQAMQGLSSAESQLGGALGRLFALAEAYPDLKANQNMMALQEELGSTENKVAFSRQGYNDAVMRYNTARETFPTMMLSGTFGFGEAMLFEIEDDQERKVPVVKF